jgi:hypothetical protein
VATAHVALAAVELHAFQVAHLRQELLLESAKLHHHHPGHPGPSLPASPLAPGQLHFRLPSNFVDWGVVTLWNNTNAPVTFTVSASTFNNGQFYPFTLQSGQNQSYFAPVVAGNAPLFQVSFSPNNANAIPLSNDNIVFESTSYVPAGTAGWPYAIGFGVNGYFISQI